MDRRNETILWIKENVDTLKTRQLDLSKAFIIGLVNGKKKGDAK